MSMYNEVTKAPSAINDKLGGFIGGMSTRLAQYRTYRRTCDELQSLTDRELADLGLSRHSIRSIAYRAAYDG